LNISSIVIQVKPEKYEILKELLTSNNLCEYHFGDIEKGKIVATIEADNVEDEIKKFMDIQNTPNVLTVDMIQTYQEDIEMNIKILENEKDVPLVLSDETIKIEDITYNGDLKKVYFRGAN